MIQVLAISGSLRPASVNSAVLRAASSLAPSGMTIHLYNELAALPLFNPDLEAASLPPAVARLRAAIGLCHAVLICSPEYARGISGPLKNALD